jgi:type IV secretory pathway VirB3-like protein
MTADDQNDTQVEEVPPHETTPSPMDVAVAMPRYFGLTPPTLLFGVATATLAVAIVLAVLAHWVAALVLAAAVLLEIVLFLGVASRKPDTAVASASARMFQRVRERAAWLVQATTVRTEAGRQLAPLRRELLELDDRRERQLRELGAAVYAGDDEAAKQVTEELNRLDEQQRETEVKVAAIADSAQEQLEQGRLRVQPTIVKRPDEETET